MRKVTIVVLLLAILSSMLAVTVEFIDENKVECQLVGKQNDAFLISYDEVVYKVYNSDITGIFINGVNIKKSELAKKDWMIQSIDQKNIVDYKVEIPQSEVKSKANLKSINEMNDREFQVYLVNMNTKAIEQSSTKISKTIWGVFWTGVVITAVGVGVVISAN